MLVITVENFLWNIIWSQFKKSVYYPQWPAVANWSSKSQTCFELLQMLPDQFEKCNTVDEFDPNSDF